MTFKTNHEKSEQPIILSTGTITAMVKQAIPDKSLSTYQVIAGGCANLNIKITLLSDQSPVILRVYLRDKEAAYREQQLGTLLKPTLPIPQSYFIGDIDDYRFAITEYLPGITLRDLLLSNTPHDVSALMFNVGRMLTTIQSHLFKIPGFFDKNLNVEQMPSTQNYSTYAHDSLNHPTVITALTPEIITKIKYHLEHFKSYWPNAHESHLVHGDYDPANILVDKVNNQWEVTGLLDWEFAHSGSSLLDIANMLRYAHQMPTAFEASFLEGLAGYPLPHDWRVTTHLLNLLSLLDCLARCPIKRRPNACADICALITYITEQLDKTR